MKCLGFQRLLKQPSSKKKQAIFFYSFYPINEQFNSINELDTAYSISKDEKRTEEVDEAKKLNL